MTKLKNPMFTLSNKLALKNVVQHYRFVRPELFDVKLPLMETDDIGNAILCLADTHGVPLTLTNVIGFLSNTINVTALGKGKQGMMVFSDDSMAAGIFDIWAFNDDKMKELDGIGKVELANGVNWC